MALLELNFSDAAKLQKERRNFDCASCPIAIQSLRRCREDRWDFTSEDASIFPMYIHKGGNLYGFCPGKATWDTETSELYRLMVVVAETGHMPLAGGILDQPGWFVDELGWFLPEYSLAKFGRQASLVFGGSTQSNAPTPQAPPPDTGQRGRR